MARALPRIPFSLSLEHQILSAPPRDRRIELRRRAEAIKDRVYQRHVASALSPLYGERWKLLDREQKLVLVGRVAERQAREEISRLCSDTELPSNDDAVARYVQESGLPDAASWERLSEDDRGRVFFAAAVRSFLRRVTEEVLIELRSDTWTGGLGRALQA